MNTTQGTPPDWGATMAAWRAENGLTVAGAARAAKVGHGTWTGLETGRSAPPSMGLALGLCRMMGMALVPVTAPGAPPRFGLRAITGDGRGGAAHPTFARTLLEAREATSLSADAAARDLGLAPGDYAALEAGSALSPTSEAALACAKTGLALVPVSDGDEAQAAFAAVPLDDLEGMVAEGGPGAQATGPKTLHDAIGLAGPDTLGRTMRRARERRRWTAHEAARHSNTTLTTWESVEGGGTPTIGLAAKICTSLGIVLHVPSGGAGAHFRASAFDDPEGLRGPSETLGAILRRERLRAGMTPEEAAARDDAMQTVGDGTLARACWRERCALVPVRDENAQATLRAMALDTPLEAPQARWYVQIFDENQRFFCIVGADTPDYERTQRGALHRVMDAPRSFEWHAVPGTTAPDFDGFSTGATVAGLERSQAEALEEILRQT